MKYFITSRKYPQDFLKAVDNTEFYTGTPTTLANDLTEFKYLQFDTETTMVPDGPDAVDTRELLVAQFGTIDRKSQYIIDMVNLSTDYINSIKTILSNENTAFIMHNANFDYKVVYTSLGVDIKNLHDTYIAIRMLHSGNVKHKGFYGLKYQLELEFGIDVSKADQTTFTKELLTESQVNYAATDVVFLYELLEIYKTRLQNWEMWDLYNNYERHLVRIYAKMELSPMRFNKEHWLKSADAVEKKVQSLIVALEAEVLKDKNLVTYILNNYKDMLDSPIIYSEDVYNMNWRSTLFRNLALREIIPNLPDNVTTKPEITKFLKTSKLLTMKDKLFLNTYLAGNYPKLDSILKTKHLKFLEDNKYFIKKGTIDINWNSKKEVLFIFRHYYPNLEATNATVLAKITANPLIRLYKKYVAASKSASTYGKSFISKYVKKDGTIAPSRTSQILSTGRIAMGIMLQIPKDNLYRNAFLPLNPKNVFIDADYGSAELLIMSTLANEQNFLKIIKSGKDAHSASASLIFGKDWLDAAEPDCAWMRDGSKCECKEHKILRTKSKSISFGLAYGLGIRGLAERLDISSAEAKILFDKYFKAFPAFKTFFEKNADFAVKHLYISTGPPMNRKRFFESPSKSYEISSIERKAKNAPIQGQSADMLKVALIKLTKKIAEYQVDDDFIIHLPMHDEILAECPKEYSQKATKLLREAMLEAADEFLEKGLMDVDLNINDKWEKT